MRIHQSIKKLGDHLYRLEVVRWTIEEESYIGFNEHAIKIAVHLPYVSFNTGQRAL
jgi:hypothetical protein